MLHHLSLGNILTTETMSYPVEQARKAFAKAAMSPDEEASISNYYLYRTGVDHLLSNNQVDDARAKLLGSRSSWKDVQAWKTKSGYTSILVKDWR